LTVQIVEILGPSDQGKSRPYKCRGEDDAIYYVKGRQTNRASLWHEWICGHLALQFGLHIPPFDIVEVGEHLLRETPAEWQDVGLGPAFGSRLHPGILWMEVGLVSKVPRACHHVPQEWHWANVEMDVPAHIDLADIQKTLNRCTSPELWRTV